MNASIPDSTIHAMARAIMGKNFLGLDEVRKSYGVTYTEEQLQQLAEIPYGVETLNERKDTHVLVAGAPLSVNEIRKIADSDFYDTNWYNREAYAATKKVDTRWYLLRKEPVPESRSKTYYQQRSLLTKEQEVPFACEVTYMVILYWLTHRERLLPDVYVRCQDMDPVGRRVGDGLRVVLGWFDGQLRVSYDSDDARSDCVWLASAHRTS